MDKIYILVSYDDGAPANIGAHKNLENAKAQGKESCNSHFEIETWQLEPTILEEVVGYKFINGYWEWVDWK